MEEFKSNSHKSKASKNDSKVEERKATKVVRGSATIQKKGAISKFASIFIAEDIANVKEFIIKDVLIPTAKKAIDDIFSEGIHMLLYKGEPRRTTGRGGVSRVSYGGFYNNQQLKREETPRTQNLSDFENILFDNRGDAEAVLTQMDEIVSMYGIVSVADLYDSAGLTCPFTWNNYGWRDIRSATVLSMQGGYVIKLPRPMPIK